MIGWCARRWLLLAVVLLFAWSIFHVASRWANRLGNGRTILRVLYFADSDEDGEIRALARSFEERRSDVSVLCIRADVDGYGPKLRTMLAANEPPDVFILRPFDVAQFATARVAEPLDGDLSASNFPEFSDLDKPVQKLFRYDVPTKRFGQGPLWGIPKDETPAVMYVNVDLFNRAGVPVPYRGWNWDQFEILTTKIRALDPTVYGAYFLLWADMSRMLIWAEDGDVFERDGSGQSIFSKPALTSAPVVRTLERLRRMQLVERTALNTAGLAKDGVQEFVEGRVGVLGPAGRWLTPYLRQSESLNFDVVPLPHRAGSLPISAIFANAWAVSPHSTHKSLSVDLAAFLSGYKANQWLAESGSTVPVLRSVAESAAFMQPALKPKNAQLFLDLLAQGKPAEWPPDSDFMEILENDISTSTQLGTHSVDRSARLAEQQWHDEQVSPINGEHAKMKWRYPISAMVLVIILIVAVAITRRHAIANLDRKQRSGLILTAPWMIGFALFTLVPMTFAAVLALTKWGAITPPDQASFVGLENFEHMLFYDPSFWKSVDVTLRYVVLAVPIGQVFALTVALLINSCVRGIFFYRTAFFIPAIIGGAALGSLWLALFNGDSGAINALLRWPLSLIGLQPPDWFGADAHWAAVPAYVFISSWGMGGSLVIYLAGLQSVPESLYEAATIDGASKAQKLLLITLPSLSPIILFNVLIALIDSFQTFAAAMVISGPGPEDSSLFYVMKLFEEAFQHGNMGYASALAWILVAVVGSLTLAIFSISRRWVHYEGLAN